MKILITGASGQLGTALTTLGCDTAHQLIALDREGLDISHAPMVSATLTHHSPDLVVNAAAYTAVDRAESESESAFAVNETGPANLASVCSSLGIPLIHISTDYVFDGAKVHAYVESDKPNPASVYGRSKLAGELAVRERLDQHLILRTSWVFESSGQNFVNTMLRLAKDRSHLSVVNDQFGGPTSASELARLIYQVIDRYEQSGELKWGTYHVSQEPHLSWYEFACEIMSVAHEAGVTPNPVTVMPISSAEFPTPVDRPKNSRLDCSLFQQTFGLQISDWKQDLQRLLEERASSVLTAPSQF